MSGVGSRKGFTIVELVIVVAVIAILAAVAIVGYGNWRQQAVESQLKSDLQGAAAAMEDARNFGSGYPNSIPSTFVASQGTTLSIGKVSAASFCLEALYTQTGTVFYLEKSGSPQSGNCPEAVIVDGSKMQDVTATNCPTDMTRTVDARDSHTYWIQKLSDGKCWMLTNLAYAGGGTNTYADTKTIFNGVADPATSTAPNYYIVPSSTSYTTEPTNPSSSTNGTGQYGYLYNWCAAMGAQLGTDACSSTDTTDATTTQSICPAGWRLPTGGPSGEFVALNNSLNGGSLSSDAGLLSGWFGQHAGSWNGTFGSQGSYGYYWSGTQYLAGSAHRLYMSGGLVIPGSYISKSYGFSVRCVVN